MCACIDADAVPTDEVAVIGKPQEAADAKPSAPDGSLAGHENVAKGTYLDRYIEVVAEYPILVCVSVHLFVIFICILPMLIFSTDLIVVDFSLASNQVRSNVISNRHFAYEAAECGGQCYEDERRLDDHYHDRHNTLTMAYVSKDGKNILTESRLQQALSLEREAAELLGEPKHTPLERFFPSYPVSTGAVGGQSLQSLLITVAEDAKDTRNQGQTLWPSFAMNFSACAPESELVTTQFRNTWDFEIFEDELSKLETDDVYATFFWTIHSWDRAEFWFSSQRDEQIGKDTLLIIGVLLSAVVIIGIQTRSFCIAIGGLFAILLATGVAFSFYRSMVSKWFGVLNAFSIFLLLGIACDDIFVVSDAWRQSVESAAIAPDDYRARVRYIVTHAFMAVTATSLTTAGAFFGNAISKIPPLRLFGIFSGFMVLADWLLTLALLPVYLVIQHQFFGGCKCGLRVNQTAAPRGIDRFLARTFAPCVFKAAPVVVIFFAMVTAVALNVALELPPGVAFHESELFPDDHVQRRAYRAQTALADMYPEYVWVQIVYGVKQVDNGDMNNPKSEAEAVWDESYDMYPAAVQQFTFDLCNDLLAQRGMVRRLESCWAQEAQSQLLGLNEAFPASSPSSLDRVLKHTHGVHDVDGHIWTSIHVETTTLDKASVSELRASYDQWEVWMQRWNEEAKRRGLPGVAQGFHTAGRWRFMSTVEEMALSCIAACCISTAIVAIMLFLLLRNLIVVSLVLVHVIGVCLTLMATLVIEGRSLGVLEGIAATLLVGLSVDYLVHVGKAYLDEPEDHPRQQRTLNAVSHLGGSVVAGSITTIVSAVFLCFGTITFFVTFGRFVISMITLALVFTLFSLVSSLYLFGPEKSISTIPCFQDCLSMCKCSTADPDCIPNDAQVNTLTEGVDVKPASFRIRLVVGIAVALIFVTGGAVRVGLSLRSSEKEDVACPAYSELEFTFEHYAVPQEQDSYRCRDFDFLPSGCTYWVTEFEPIVTEGLEGVVHHMILFSTEGKAATCPYTCFDMPNAVGIDAAWAVGGRTVKWPEGMAYTIGGYKQSLQMHYYNYAESPNHVDTRSGIKLKLTSIPPVQAISNIIIGLHPLGQLSIPPRNSNITRFVECTPQLRGKVTVLAYSTHAHKLAVSILTEVRRPRSSGPGREIYGGPSDVVGDVGSDANYDFNYQHIKTFPTGQERHMTPGDTVRVTCTYNSMSRDWETSSGWGSEDEMCMTAIFAYPSENVQSMSCLSEYSYSL